jgi:predicted esterase
MAKSSERRDRGTAAELLHFCELFDTGLVRIRPIDLGEGVAMKRLAFRWIFGVLLGMLGASLAQAGHRLDEAPRFIGLVNEAQGPAVVLLPGAALEGAAYMGLAYAIIKEQPQASVFIVKFSHNFPNPIEAKAGTEAVLASLEARGWSEPEASTYVMGHSLGGIFAQPLVKQLNLGGIVLLGSYLPRTLVLSDGMTLDKFPKPILLLAGELDGLTPLHFVARDYRDALQVAEGEVQNHAHLTLVLHGVNHSGFADGRPLADDLTAEVGPSMAHSRMAAVITQFMAANGAGNFAAGTGHLLDDLSRETAKILTPLLAAEALDEGICTDLQGAIAGLVGGSAPLAIQAERYNNFFKFVRSKPTIAGIESQRISVPYYVEMPPNILDVSRHQSLAPATIACKMKSRAAVAEALELTPPHDKAPSCGELARGTAERAWSLLTPEQRQRVVAAGSKLSFATQEHNNGIGWVSAFFKFKASDDPKIWLVTSQQLSTGLTSVFPGTQGMQYCKTVAPSRLVEWYLREALR